MAVKNKKPNAQKVKPAKKQRPQESSEEEEEEDDIDEGNDSLEDAEVPSGSDQELDEEDSGEEEEEDSDEEEGDSDEEEEEKVEVAKPATKRKAEKVVKEEVTEEAKTLNTVFVGHIKYTVDKKAIETFFSKAGPVDSVRIIKRKGYAFVRFVNIDSVEEALKMDKQPLDGRAVHIERVKTSKQDAQKRKAEQHGDQPKAKKAKEGKVVQLNPAPKPKGKGKPGKPGKPKTPQKPNPNKKQNKVKPGQFVKAK